MESSTYFDSLSSTRVLLARLGTEKQSKYGELDKWKHWNGAIRHQHNTFIYWSTFSAKWWEHFTINNNGLAGDFVTSGSWYHLSKIWYSLPEYKTKLEAMMTTFLKRSRRSPWLISIFLLPWKPIAAADGERLLENDQSDIEAGESDWWLEPLLSNILEMWAGALIRSLVLADWGLVRVRADTDDFVAANRFSVMVLFPGSRDRILPTEEYIEA